MREEELVDELLAGAGDACAQASDGPGGGGVVLGPGDDAALLAPPAGHTAAWSVDDHIEGVHFRAAWCSPRALGRKAVGAALSDLAAMGARPAGALLALGVPKGFGRNEARALGLGVGEKLSAARAALLGGNVARSTAGLRVSVSVLGWVPAGRGLLRGRARTGDALFVSGTLGLARAGLLHLERGGDPREELFAPAVARLLDPEPRLALGETLAARGERVACMDLSDGLARDLPRLLAASGVAARVDAERLPGPPADLARALGETPAALAWVGGEDYELLVAGSHELEGCNGLRRIGCVVPGPPGAVRVSGEFPGARAKGFDHLAP